LQAAKGTIVVRAFKYDGTEHRTWPAQLLRQEGSLLVLDAKFDEEIHHDLLGTISGGTISVEYYWLDRWYNIFRFIEPSGELRSYYCNVSVPPTFDGQTLSYVDLDVDILVEPNFSYQVVDLEDFKRNAMLYNYPAQTQQNVRQALDELAGMIDTRAFPFNE
jgi:protein associated with RNAse G/E